MKQRPVSYVSTAMNIHDCGGAVVRGSVPHPSWGTALLQTNGTRSLSPERWRRYIPPKRRFLKDPHDVIPQKTTFLILILLLVYSLRSPLWSSGQSSLLQFQKSRNRFPRLPDFLSSSTSGTGSTLPHKVKWGATSEKSSGSGLITGETPRWQRVTSLSAKVGTRIHQPGSVTESVKFACGTEATRFVCMVFLYSSLRKYIYKAVA
jgi:hypothetical protein